jgi:hypothetical protein
MLTTLLGQALQAIALYRAARDKALAAGEVTNTDGSVKTDAELIELFAKDAAAMRDHADAVIAKHGGS